MKGLPYRLLTTGLAAADPTVLFLVLAALVVIMLLLVIVQNVRIHRLENKLKSFMKGKDVASLESELVSLFKDNKQLMKHAARSKRDIEDIRTQMLTHVSRVGIVKYDAFQQMGGQLSFALCMLDTEENGFVLNSVQSAEGCYSYIKEIIAGQSTIELGREEREALQTALEGERIV